MNLTFQILWFEDQTIPTARKNKIQTHLKDKFGLSFVFTQMKGNEELKGEDFNRYDLILMDYSLCQNHTGVQKFKLIREKHSYVDVAFYSTTKDDLLDDLSNLDFEIIEGAYLLDLDNDNLFYDKLFAIIAKIVKRSESIENLRGIVLNQTADFDKNISDLIKKLVEKFSLKKDINTYIESDLQKNLVKSFCKKTINFDNASCKFTFCTDKNSSIPYLDSSNSAKLLNTILYLLVENKQISKKDFSYTDYLNEIIHYRNAFAHTCCDNNSITVKNNTIKITDELHKCIREILFKYKVIFDELNKIAC